MRMSLELYNELKYAPRRPVPAKEIWDWERSEERFGLLETTGTYLNVSDFWEDYEACLDGEWERSF